MVPDARAATVALMTRAPVLGRVKTRLARTLGDAGALAVHRTLFTRTLAALSGSSEFDVEVHVDGDPALLGSLHRPVVRQPSGDLGTRMAAAVESITRRGRIAVVVGSDCPLLEARHVDAAVGAIRAGADIAIVPVEDGGYVLIAMGALHRCVFDDMTWSTKQVLAETCERAERAALRVALLECLWDVDDVADWRRYCAITPQTPDGQSSG